MREWYVLTQEVQGRPYTIVCSCDKYREAKFIFDKIEGRKLLAAEHTVNGLRECGMLRATETDKRKRERL